MIGETIGHFRIDRLLGEGGMGKVYLATDTKLDRKVALKMLPSDLAEDTGRLLRFEREAKTLAALNHPTIVTVYSIEEFDGQRYIAMEFVEGDSLRSAVTPTGVSPERLLEIGTSLCSALGAAHAAGILHRDIKPENVMSTPDGSIKLLDFGIAKLPPAEESTTTEDMLTKKGHTPGTRPYMSPEQLVGAPINHQSDLFSLGVMLYELAVGERPFKQSGAILHSTAEPVSKLRPDLPKALDKVFDRCLEKNPEERIESAEAMGEALSDALDKGRSGVRLGPKQLVAGALALLGALAVVFWLGSETSQGGSAGGLASDEPRIVVLPFESLGEEADPLFADGVTDEVTSQLTQVDGLEVISQLTARVYAERRMTVPEMAAKLGLDYVLSGSVRGEAETSDERLRVTPQLIQTDRDVQIWSESFDTVVGNLLTAQAAIAQAVAERMGVELLERSRGVPTDAEALPGSDEAVLALLRGRSLVRDGVTTPEELTAAVEAFETAAQSTPGSAAPHVELAQLFIDAWHSGLDRSDETRSRASDSISLALDLEPGEPSVLRALARYNRWIPNDSESALEAYEQLLQQAPNDPEALAFRAETALAAGDVEAALPDLETAWRLDPYNGDLTEKVVAALQETGATERLEATCAALIELPGLEAAPAACPERPAS